jgi:hypothetical protein
MLLSHACWYPVIRAAQPLPSNSATEEGTCPNAKHSVNAGNAVRRRFPLPEDLSEAVAVNATRSRRRSTWRRTALTE